MLPAGGLDCLTHQLGSGTMGGVRPESWQSCGWKLGENSGSRALALLALLSASSLGAHGSS